MHTTVYLLVHAYLVKEQIDNHKQKGERVDPKGGSDSIRPTTLPVEV
jgi:hypothetical protein